MDVDATTETECLPACGSFCFLPAAADAVEILSAETDAAMIAACGSSCFCAAAAVSEITDAAADQYLINYKVVFLKFSKRRMCGFPAAHPSFSLEKCFILFSIHFTEINIFSRRKIFCQSN